MNKTTEALKLAAKALSGDYAVHPDEALAAIREALDHSGDANEMVMDWSKVKPEAIKSDPMYQMGYAAAKAEPVKQEPVAWAHPNGGYLSDKYIKEFATGMEKANYNIPLYAAPVDAKTIRAEALEEAAQECDKWASVKPFSDFSSGSAAGARNCAAAIRGLK